MEYSIKELSRLSGLTARTLRWYDEIGLLIPGRVSEGGYRYYSQEQAERLWNILFYRSLGFELSRIREILDAPDFDRLQAMKEHLNALEQRQKDLKQMIDSVRETINREEMRETVGKEKSFEALKKQIIQENECAYGEEARAKYGNEEVEAANAKLMNLSREQYDEWKRLDEEIRNRLSDAVRNGTASESSEGKEISDMHKKWLSFTNANYSRAMHRGIAEMYVADDRFTAYYDRETEGCARFLRDAVLHWVK